jgi:hypothetical protein
VKEILVVLLVVGLAYYVVTNHSIFQGPIDPYFVKIQIHIPTPNASTVKIVGIGKMHSLKDCQARSKAIWNRVFDDMGKVKIDTECKKEIANKYLKLFEGEQSTATYIAYDKGESSEDRDGRFVIYGVPSTMVYKACDQIIKNAKKEENYSGKIYCVKGSVG